MKTLFALVLFASVMIAQAQDAAGNSSAAAGYEHWTQPWASRPLTNSIPGGPDLLAVVTTVKGEVPLANIAKMTPVERLYVAYQVKVIGTEIATNGACRNYFSSNTDAESVPVRHLSTDDFKRLQELLANLPDDDRKLPPPGNRVVVQVAEGGHWNLHVYDGSALPAQIQTILQLISNPFSKT